jgi:hypothetical protein
LYGIIEKEAKKLFERELIFMEDGDGISREKYETGMKQTDIYKKN